MHGDPVVSIGLPVFNGENYLVPCIESILAQSFKEFELIICDNASSDKTEALCRAFAERDGRIRYYRSNWNRGAAPNFNWAFGLSFGEFFKWASHDDVMMPQFLTACVNVMMNDSSVALCLPRVGILDSAGCSQGHYSVELVGVSSNYPSVRFADVTLGDHACYHIFGLIRSSVLEQTPLIGSYLGSDRNLLAELALRGRFGQVDEVLFLVRDHRNRSTKIPRPARLKWFDSSRTEVPRWPYWRQMGELGAAVRRAGVVKGERWRCYAVIAKWIGKHGRHLLNDIRSRIWSCASRAEFHDANRLVQTRRDP